MRKIIIASRILLSIGMALAVVPSLYIYFRDKPEWLGEAIYLSSAWVVASVVVMALCTEVYYCFFKSIYPAVTLLAATLAAVLSASIYINGATFFGAGTADINTWHLLPLFTALHQIKATIFVTLTAGAACILFLLGKALARRLA